MADRNDDVSFKAFLMAVHSDVCKALRIRRKASPMVKLMSELYFVFLPLALLYMIGMLLPIVVISLFLSRIFYWLWRDGIARRRVLSGGGEGR